MNYSAALDLTRGPSWKNRLVLAPMTNQQSNPDGTLSDDEYRWLIRRAEGGFAMVMTCAAHVSREGQAFPGQLGIFSDDHLDGLRRIATGIRAAGAVSAVQLHHAGRIAQPSLTGLPLACPYADARTGAEPMTEAHIKQAIDDFIAAAVRAETAGFDGVEVHGAHGYLLTQFLDGTRNTRTDQYGGSLTNRSRALFEVVEGIRAHTRPDFQVGVRITAERQGVVLGEAKIVAGELLASGHLDYLDLSLWDAFKTPAEPEHEGWLLDHFTELPRHGVALGVAGKVLSASDAATLIDRGADYVTIGTGAIVHHDFARRALEDPTYVAPPQPFTESHLVAESVGPAFLDYLSTNWDDFVTAG